MRELTPIDTANIERTVQTVLAMPSEKIGHIVPVALADQMGSSGGWVFCWHDTEAECEAHRKALGL